MIKEIEANKCNKPDADIEENKLIVAVEEEKVKGAMSIGIYDTNNI